ncbi:MAG: hypothetical protein HG446_000600 [Flavobacteriaceae bacterium]|jgi:hypothetical protein|nr:hypothetical protein [Flavobacteriaceae bacterium]
MKRKLSILALAAAFSLPCKAQESSVAVEVENVKQSKVTVMASAGYAWRTAKIPSGTAYYLKNHFEKLTSGFNFDISAYHRIGPNMGLGLKFNRYSASAQTSPAGVYLSTKDRIIFIGPSFLYSNFERETPHKIYYDMAIGYVQYTSNTFVNNQKIENKGSALGLYSTIGYQYAVNRSFLIGPQIGFGLGVLKSYTENGVRKTLGNGEKEGLGRVSLAATATIRF